MYLPTGAYYITNAGDIPVGINPGPPVRPVVRVNGPRLWSVYNLGGDHYHLDIDGSVTVAQGNLVESDRNPGVKGTTWIIRQYQPGLYTIITLELRQNSKGWTLNPGVPNVSLEPVPPKNVRPAQLWVFRPLITREEEEELGEEEN